MHINGTCFWSGRDFGRTSFHHGDFSDGMIFRMKFPVTGFNCKRSPKNIISDLEKMSADIEQTFNVKPKILEALPQRGKGDKVKAVDLLKKSKLATLFRGRSRRRGC